MVGNPINLYGVLVKAGLTEAVFDTNETLDKFFKCTGNLWYPQRGASGTKYGENCIHEVGDQLILFFEENTYESMVLVVCYAHISSYKDRDAAERALIKSVSVGENAIKKIARTKSTQ
jgi:hypothetical protein